MKKRKAQVEHIDYDYLDKLSPEELEWLQAFTNSYYSDTTDSRFPNDPNKSLRNNANRRDIYNNAKRTGLSAGLKEAENDGNTNVSERLADWSDNSVATAAQKRREGYRAYRQRIKRDAGQSGTDKPSSRGSDDET